MTDEFGNVVWSAEYSAFGKATAAGLIINNLRFPGQYYDDETGLHYNWYRYYDPKMGRYISVDPIGFEGGDVNLMRYVGNSPANYSDPMGLFGWEDMPNIPQPVGDFFAGFGDTLSGNAMQGALFSMKTIGGMWWLDLVTDTSDLPSPTEAVRQALGVDDKVSKCSTAYKTGKWGAYAWEIAFTGSLSGPKGVFFGRARYRSGKGSGIFNRGDIRFGWSWNAAKGRNYFGPHGGKPGTPDHWHGLFKNPNWMIPGPRGPMW